MSSFELIDLELKRYIDDKKAAFLPKFFNAFPGGYGEGDKFLGVSVPNQRTVASKFKNLSANEIHRLLISEYHEHRLTALFILVHQFSKANPEMQKELAEFYLAHLKHINNWDLVDSSAHKILGRYLLKKDRSLLYELAISGELWKQRIAVISCMEFIRRNDFLDILKISESLLSHPHDLIHKAVGWMLREIGNRDKQAEVKFLKCHYANMPRTMLRYAIEKFPEEERQAWLKGDMEV